MSLHALDFPGDAPAAFFVVSLTCCIVCFLPFLGTGQASDGESLDSRTTCLPFTSLTLVSPTPAFAGRHFDGSMKLRSNSIPLVTTAPFPKPRLTCCIVVLLYSRLFVD